MSEPSLAIVSTGRCGTQYMTRVLRAAGISCGHEGWWNLDLNRSDGLLADSSWLAVGHLNSFAGQVFHMTAEPIKVVSRLQNELDPEHSGKYALERQRVSGVTPSGNDLVDTLAAYNAYIGICEEHADFTFQVERVNTDLVIEIGWAVGVAVPRNTARMAVESMPTDANSKLGSYRPLRLRDLPLGPERDRFIQWSHTLGYGQPRS